MDYIFSFIVAIAAGVACHYIIKWLDRDKQPVTSLWINPPCQNGTETPQSCRSEGFLARYGELFRLGCCCLVSAVQPFAYVVANYAC